MKSAAYIGPQWNFFYILNRDHMLPMNVIIPWTIILQCLTATLKKAIWPTIFQNVVYSSSKSIDLPSHLKDLEDVLHVKLLKEWLTAENARRARRNGLQIKCRIT